MSENQNQSGGQRLRWWQDEKATIPPIGGVAVRVKTAEEEIAVTIPDIGMELEAEALRRSVAHARGERVEIYANAGQNNARLRKRMFIVALPMVVLYGLIPILLHSPEFFAMWFFIIFEFAAIYIWMRRVNAKQHRPIVTLTREGMEIHSLGHDLGLVRWDEIEEIRAYTQIYRYVGIVPKNVKGLCARLTGKQSALLTMNEFCRRWFYRPLRCYVAPINLAQQNMPISADELVKQIENFRRENGV